MTRKLLCMLLLALAFAVVKAAPQQQQQPAQPKTAAQTGQPAAQQQMPTPPHTHLRVGDPAPDFTLIDTERNKVKLSDFRGKKNVVLAFYVLAFTGG